MAWSDVKSIMIVHLVLWNKMDGRKLAAYAGKEIGKCYHTQTRISNEE